MHPPPQPPHTPLQQVATHAERLARETKDTRMGMVFQGITAVSMGVVTLKMIFDMVWDKRDPDGPRKHTPRDSHFRR